MDFKEVPVVLNGVQWVFEKVLLDVEEVLGVYLRRFFWFLRILVSGSMVLE